MEVRSLPRELADFPSRRSVDPCRVSLLRSSSLRRLEPPALSESRPAAVIILAAGEGSRMKSATPKVLHEVLGRSLLGHVLAATVPLAADETVVVVGHARDRVVGHLGTIAEGARWVEQVPQHGTGHAVRIALDAAPDLTGSVLVVCADTPLLTGGTLTTLMTTHARSGNAATVLTARVPDPTGYGRIIRDVAGQVAAIVEHPDADIEQRNIDEINSGIYAFDLVQLRRALAELTRDNSQGEEYLTDVIALLRLENESVGAVIVADHREVLGVNDRVQLAEARRVLRDRINNRWMRAGVSIVDPSTTWIDVGVHLAADATIHPQTTLSGVTSVAQDAEVGPGCSLANTSVAAGAVVRQTTADGAVIGPGASVGPYTYLRPGTVLAGQTRAGAFVETKNVTVGQGSKVPHLSYVGDAEIGEGSNIGAATVFVNYDGVEKHRTVIGDHVRIGSDTMLVAPIRVGDGAYTAAGSVITQDVPPGALGVSRAKQRSIEGWVARKRPGSSSAAAAAAVRRGPETDSNAGSEDNEPAPVPTPADSGRVASGETDREGHAE
jgi:bifunctional UDP-N-acetylglucosamine pyrophosphorylase/glucosamine-1-phosphate N-acetyltransferase